MIIGIVNVCCRLSINPDYSYTFLIELRIEYSRSFSVVPPCEVFASLFLGLRVIEWVNLLYFPSLVKRGWGRFY